MVEFNGKLLASINSTVSDRTIVNEAWTALDSSVACVRVFKDLQESVSLNVRFASGITLHDWLLQLFFLGGKNIASASEAKGIVFRTLRKTSYLMFKIRLYCLSDIKRNISGKYSLLLSLGQFVSWYCLQLNELLIPSTDFVVFNTNLTITNATLCNYFLFQHQWTACSCAWMLICMTAPSCLWRVRHLLSTITAENQRAAPWWASQKQAYVRHMMARSLGPVVL